MENLSIFQITEDLIQLFEISEENEGVLDDEMQEALEIRADQLQNKALQYVNVIKHIESQEDLAAKEIKRLGEVKKKLESHKNRLLGVLNDTVTTFGEKKKLTPAQTKAGMPPNRELVLQDGLVKLTTKQTQVVNIEFDPKKLDHSYTYVEMLKIPREILEEFLKENKKLEPYIKGYHPDKRAILAKLKDKIGIEGTSIGITHGITIK